MNNYEETCQPCIVDEKEESIASIVRDNSNKISSAFSSVCNILSMVSGKSSERNLNGNEPHNLSDELLWQRSMLCRIEEELSDLATKLGC